MALRIYNLNNPIKSDIFLRCLSSKSSSYDYQYLQRSKIPTMHFQKSLPRLPVPKLEDTCKRYLDAQRPILTSEEYKNTESYTKIFEDREGKQLQELLLAQDKQNRHTSYISEPWFHMYLSDRIPLPINYNPAMIFQDDKKPNYSTQVLRATNLVISSLRFVKSLRKNILEPEVFHLNPKKTDTKLFRTITSKLPSSISWYGAYMFNAYPLDMSQYNKLFNSTRIPLIGKDKLYQDVNAKHIMVMRNGHFYIVDVLDKEGQILPANVLFTKMKQILDEDCSNAEIPLGVLTSENRDEWAKVRDYMITKHPENSEFFKKIDSALFNIVLDDDVINGNRLKMIRHYLHSNGKNR